MIIMGSDDLDMRSFGLNNILDMIVVDDGGCKNKADIRGLRKTKHVIYKLTISTLGVMVINFKVHFSDISYE